MTEKDREKIFDANDRFAQGAMRVLGFAYRENPPKSMEIHDTEKNLVFVGLAGMIDPPREGVAKSIEIAKKAGIKVIIITGDHAATATAIARQIGLYPTAQTEPLTIDAGAVSRNPVSAGGCIRGPGTLGARFSESDIVLNGEDIDRLDEKELDAVIGKVRIISRALPIQKLRIINALKRQGEIVVMTGDGVNDAPALKKADAGISMGITGTDVAKEVSGATITDDNFSTIISGISEGRNIYDKIMNSTRYLLSCNLGEITIVLATIVFRLPVPLVPLQILAMNLLTDGLPALGLGFEKSDPKAMQRPPTRQDETPLGGKMLAMIIGFGAIMGIGSFAVFHQHLGEGIVKAQTMAFTTLVMFQMFAAVGSRSAYPFKSIGTIAENKWLVAGIASSVMLQVAIIYIAPLQALFGTTAISILDWAKILAVSSLGFILMEAGKILTLENSEQQGQTGKMQGKTK